MSERPLTIAAYAAGASLTAITLVYVFGPTFFLDDEAANSSRANRKKGVVGLANPANDCFINSVLQALATLPALRLYLIREIYQRNLDGSELYKDPAAALEEQQRSPRSKKVPEWQLLGLQQGVVTAGLKEVLDALNERPIYKKTISAQPFIRVVEQAFRSRINRTQQDAQEFLHVIVERLADEHHAAQRVRRRSRRAVPKVVDDEGAPNNDADGIANAAADATPDSMVQQHSKLVLNVEDADASEAPIRQSDEPSDNQGISAFPFEGKLESQVECSHCHFKPKPSVSSFVILPLHVPHDSGPTTLNACLDGLLKIEHIDDFICDRCRLEHALQVNGRQLARTGLSEKDRADLEQDRAKLEAALIDDPEKPPEHVKLPNSSTAPKRRIGRHTRISEFPRILAIHLSRSVWDPYSSSTKNMSKVAFPEMLPLGGLLERKTYRLLSVITHKGGHNSGHYETSRRQFLSPPFSTPTSMGTEGLYSLRPSPAVSPGVSAAPSPRLSARPSRDGMHESQPSTPGTPPSMSPSLDTRSSSSSASFRSQQLGVKERRPQPPKNVPSDTLPTRSLSTPPLDSKSESILKRSSSISKAINLPSRKRKAHDRWWRISDDKVKESKTSDVLGDQREVYLLFYEMVDDVQL